jgi:TolA-binding protein
VKGVDLHPEDLLEREACGELTPAEADRLRTHLEVCEVCRFERLARRDVRAEVDEAEEVDVQRLLSTVLTPEMLRRPAALPAPTPRRRIQPRVLLLAAAMLTIASVAGAAGWTELREKVSGRHPAIETQVEAPARTSTVAARPLPAKVAALPGPVASLDPGEETPAVAALVEPPAPELPLAAAPLPPEPRATTTHVVAPPAQELVTANVVRATVAPAPAPEPPVGAAGLFDHANVARHTGDRTGAIQGYRALLAQYPTSAEAHQALAALGKMLLDGGDSGAAVRCFDDYLRTGGPLRQDVMADRALALQRLGRPGDEAAAWSALLASYPASVHAERARRRLAELEKP